MDGCSDLPTGIQARLFTQTTLRCVGVCVCLSVCVWYKPPKLDLQKPTPINTHISNINILMALPFSLIEDKSTKQKGGK